MSYSITTKIHAQRKCKTMSLYSKKCGMKSKRVWRSDLGVVPFNGQGICRSLTVVKESGDMDNILITDSSKQ